MKIESCDVAHAFLVATHNPAAVKEALLAAAPTLVGHDTAEVTSMLSDLARPFCTELIVNGARFNPAQA